MTTKTRPKVSIHVRKLGFLQYLKETFGSNAIFIIEKINVRSGDYTSFKIDSREELLEKLLDSSSWPEVQQFFPKSKLIHQNMPYQRYRQYSSNKRRHGNNKYRT